MDRHSEILDLCAIAEHALSQIPLEVESSRVEYFAPRNLWSSEIESTCNQIIQYYRACGLLNSQGVSSSCRSFSQEQSTKRATASNTWLKTSEN